MVRYALGVPLIRDALDRSSFSLPGRQEFPTTDDLLASWPPLVGGKTGHTQSAGWSEAAAASRRGATVYGTVLGADTRAGRNTALRTLLEFGLDRYRRVAVVEASRVYGEVETRYDQPSLELVAERTLVRTVREGTPLLERTVQPTRVALPVRAGQRLGRVEVWEGDRHGCVVEPDRCRVGFGAEHPRESLVVRRDDRGERVGDRHMIVTVTVNAALDRTLTVPVFQIGFRHRSSEVLTLAGGKGINVARSLKLLDVPVVATGLTGGRTGTRIVEELTAEAILNDFVRIAGESRTSTAVVDPTAGTYTEINEWGPEVTSVELETLMEKLHYLSRGADFVVFAGSLPRKVPTEFYADAIRDLVRRDVRVVLDSEGEALHLGVQAGPYLVSPNQREAEQLVGQELEDDDDFLMALDAIAEMGARNVVITLENGCFALLRLGRKTRAPARLRSARRACVGRGVRRRSPRAAACGDRRGAIAGLRSSACRRCRRRLRAGGWSGPLRPGARHDALAGYRARGAPARPLVLLDSAHARAAQGRHDPLLRPRRLDCARGVHRSGGAALAHAPLLRGSPRRSSSGTAGSSRSSSATR